MRRTAVTGLLLAWLCANGVLLDVLQVVAWGRMCADYMQTMPASEALELTFDLGKPCNLCMAVRRAREAEKKSLPAALTAATDRLVLICQQADPVVPPGPPGQRFEFTMMRAPRRCDPVPRPPPRSDTARLFG